MRALVTGCAGFIGSVLADRLLSRGYQVVGVDSLDDYYAREIKERNLSNARTDPAFTFVEADLIELAAERPQAGSSGSLRGIVESVDHVFHLAAQPGVRGSWGRSFEPYARNNVLATQMLLECAKDAEVESFVCASSSSVYGDTTALPMREDAECRPFSPYGVTKLASEHLARLYARNFGLPAVSLRFFTVYGPRQRPDMAFHRFITAIIEDRPIVLYGDGAQTRDFTYISDIVDGIVAAPMAAPGEVLNLGGGCRVSLTDALAVLESVVGKPIKIQRSGVQAGDVSDTWAAVDHAREALGYNPQIDLAQGLDAQYRWMCGGL